MNASFKSGFHRCSLVLVGLCLLPCAALAQVLSASGVRLIGLGGNSFISDATSTRCIGSCDTAPGTPCTGDAECVGTGPCVGFPDERCSGNPAGITTVIDDVDSLTNACPEGFGINGLASVLFSWFSISELPGGTFFPKIFSGISNFGGATNTWQTTSLVNAMPGIVRSQVVCFPETFGPTPISGPIGFFNAMAWSPDFSDTAVASVQAIESASLASSSTLADGAGSEVRLESLVDEVRPGVYRYGYIFENVSPETVTISWDSANLTRTLEPYEVITVTQCFDFGARESQGYAHVVDLDGESIADMVSMALVPIEPSASQRRCPQEKVGRIRSRPESR